jgi:Tetratricopeptide repeat.
MILNNELNKNKTDPKIRFRLAMAYQNMGQNDQAEKHYENTTYSRSQ